MSLILSIGFLVISQTGDAKPAVPDTNLRIEGKKGVEILGVCISPDGKEIKNFEGILPMEVQLEYGIRRCRVSTKAEDVDAPVKLRLFQKGKSVYSNEFETPAVGLEIVIPFK